MKSIEDIIQHYTKEDKPMELDLNAVSQCCHYPIVTGAVHDSSPLGRGEYNGFGITYGVEICECCGMEADPIDQCGWCGVVGCKNECIVDISEGEE